MAKKFVVIVCLMFAISCVFASKSYGEVKPDTDAIAKPNRMEIKRQPLIEERAPVGIPREGATEEAEVSWAWKLGTVDDVFKFINGRAPYEHPVEVVDMVSNDTGRGIYVFYRRNESAPTDWGWTLKGDINAIVDFLRGESTAPDVGSAVVKEAHICKLRDGYYIFYRR